MRMIWTIIWSFLLSAMATYVISNMTGGHFEFSQVIVLTIVFVVTAVVLGEGLLKDETQS